MRTNKQQPKTQEGKIYKITEYFNPRTKRWYVRTHGREISKARYLMEKQLNRRLTLKEIVHHIDGDKTNDVISNLQLMSRAEHQRLHNPKKGHVCSEETKNKLRERNLGKKHTEETKLKIGLKHKGRKQSKEWIEKRCKSFEITIKQKREGCYANK